MKPIPDPFDEPAIARALRDEATADSPRFNALLHERIMQRVRNASPIAAHRPARWPVRLAIAAAAVLILSIGIHFLYDSKPPGPVATNLPSADPLAGVSKIVGAKVIPAGDRLVSSLDDQSRLGNLDDNARQLADFVIDRLSLAMVNR